MKNWLPSLVKNLDPTAEMVGIAATPWARKARNKGSRSMAQNILRIWTSRGGRQREQSEDQVCSGNEDSLRQPSMQKQELQVLLCSMRVATVSGEAQNKSKSELISWLTLGRTMQSKVVKGGGAQFISFWQQLLLPLLNSVQTRRPPRREKAHNVQTWEKNHEMNHEKPS
jgi:hypothetical protein